MKTLYLSLNFVFIISLSFSQLNKNAINIQTGLFHQFFDGTPMINTQKNHKNLGVFSGALYNSVGIQYDRNINEKSSLSFGYAYYNEKYWMQNPNTIEKKIDRRFYNTFSFTYERRLLLTEKIALLYGAGANYRQGYELIAVASSSFGRLYEKRNVSDLGINIQTGISFDITNRLFLFSKLNMLSFIYMNDKELQGRYNGSEVYNYQKHRFDLSWNVGLGFRF